MPKAILEYNLPEELSEYEDAINGTSYSCVLHSLYNWLRNQWKYGSGDIPGEAAEKVWDFVSSELDERGLSI